MRQGYVAKISNRSRARHSFLVVVGVFWVVFFRFSFVLFFVMCVCVCVSFCCCCCLRIYTAQHVIGRKLFSCGYTALRRHAGVTGDDRADRLAGKATLTSHLSLGRSKYWKALETYLRAQSQRQHTIDRLEERGVERGSARWSSLKGREMAIVSQTNIGTGLKGTLGKLPRNGMERIYGIFRGHRHHPELNWTELNWTAQATAVLTFCILLDAGFSATSV